MLIGPVAGGHCLSAEEPQQEHWCGWLRRLHRGADRNPHPLPIIRDYPKLMVANPSPDYGIRSFEGYDGAGDRGWTAARQGHARMACSRADDPRTDRRRQRRLLGLERGGSNYVDFVTIDRSGSIVR